MKVVALTPDLGDRGRIESLLPGAEVTFVGAAALLPGAAAGADVVLVDLTRAGAVDVLEEVVGLGARVVAYGPHVDSALLAAATVAGAEAVPRSRLFSGKVRL